MSATNPAISLLKKDHDTVKELFEKFEKTESRAAKKKIVDQAISELKVHAVIEEELFYPAVRKPVGNDIMNEADEEHHPTQGLDMRSSRERHEGCEVGELPERRHRNKQEEDAESTTVGGLASEWFGRVPHAGESIARDGILLEILSANELRVEQVRVSKLEKDSDV